MIYLRVLLIVSSCGWGISAQTTLKGCLMGDSRQFYLDAVNDHRLYAMTGNTDRLAVNVYREIEVRGNSDLSAMPWPTFKVDKLLDVFKIILPSLNPSFSDKATWHTETDQAHGIKFARPLLMAKLPRDDDGVLQSNFLAAKPVASVARFALPKQLYPKSNFAGGEFAIFVDPSITTTKRCSVFKDDNPKFRSAVTIAGVHYATTQNGGAAAGTSANREYLHTFQNSRCYEFGFVFLESSTADYDLGCLIPALRREDELKIIEPLMNAVSFLAR